MMLCNPRVSKGILKRNIFTIGYLQKLEYNNMGSVGNATFQGTLLTIPVIVLKKSRGCKKKKWINKKKIPGTTTNISGYILKYSREMSRDCRKTFCTCPSDFYMFLAAQNLAYPWLLVTNMVSKNRLIHAAFAA